MKKKLIVTGIVVILITIGLSGCNESGQTAGDTDKIELVDYDVETKSIAVNTYDDYKLVSGTIRNIAGEPIHKVTVSVKFYDSNDNLLHTETDDVWDIANSYTEYFEVAYWHTDQYYENVDWNDIRFEFKVS